MKQFFNFDKHIFPPASAPFRRGVAIGISISVTMIVILNMVSGISWYFRNSPNSSMTTMIFSGVLVLILGMPWNGLPWDRFWVDSQFEMFVCNLINGAIFGILMGFAFKVTRIVGSMVGNRQSRDE